MARVSGTVREGSPLRCNVGRFEDGSIMCCPRMLRWDRLHKENLFVYSGIVPPPHKIKNYDLRERLQRNYVRRRTNNGARWKKENGWTHEMIRVVMKTAREMEE